MKKYSFDLHFNNPKSKSSLAIVSNIYINGVCIIAKNTRRGGLYISRYIENINGKFAYVAGSISTPMLYAEKGEIIIKVKDFPKNPQVIFENEHVQDCLQEFIFIKNITEN